MLGREFTKQQARRKGKLLWACLGRRDKRKHQKQMVKKRSCQKRKCTRKSGGMVSFSFVRRWRGTTFFSWLQRYWEMPVMFIQRLESRGSSCPSCSSFLLGFVDGPRWVHCHRDIPGKEVSTCVRKIPYVVVNVYWEWTEWTIEGPWLVGEGEPSELKEDQWVA